jgi:hypothetical protein
LLVISHRGFWTHEAEKNTRDAIRRSVACGFGTETDVRDLAGRLVVSHDPPGEGAIDWAEVVSLFEDTQLPLAVNVKADGLSQQIGESFHNTDVDWFAFDMSGPETYRFARAELPFFTRHSDIEREPILYGAAQGVWLDAFESDWYDNRVIEAHLAAGKRVCVVSPELHGRDPQTLWTSLGDFGDQVILCTDLPDRFLDARKPN